MAGKFVVTIILLAVIVGGIFLFYTFLKNPVKTAEVTAVNTQIPSTLGWYQIPDTKLSDVCPPDAFGYPFSTKCGLVISAWGGGIDDTKRNRLVIWGGGHGDYAGNELYALDLSDLKMKRLNNPSPPTSGSSPSASDGKANSRHTYNGLAYIEHLDKMFVFGGSLYSSGATQSDTWFLDLETLQWTRISATGPNDGYNSHAFYDPQTKKIFLGDRNNLWRFDPDAKTYTRIASYSHELPTSSVLDPKRRIWLTIGGTYNSPNSPFVKAINVDTGAIVSMSLSGCSAITTTQAPGNQDGSGPAMAYDPVTDKIIAWMTGDTIWTIDLETKSCTSRTFAGGPDTPTTQGTYGRFRYFPSLGVFALVNKAGQNAYLLRLMPSNGTSSGDTTPPTVSVSHSPASIIASTAVDITATATDAGGISSLEIFVDGLSKKICTSSPCTYPFTYSAGTHTYFATAKDSANNAGRDPLSGTKPFSVSNTTTQTTCTNKAGFASNCVGNNSVLSLTNPSVSGSTLTITPSVSTSGINTIYNIGYYWSQAQNQWIPFTLTGTAYPGTNGSTWLTNSASKQLSIPTSAAINNVIYVATWDYVYQNNWVGPSCIGSAGNCWRIAAYTIQNQIGDTTAPTVSITSPSSGQIVSGTTTITSTASDNVGVVGVQFKVDNINIGAEDIVSPYSVLWTTTGITNGNHVITATARDLAGNTKISTGVVVNVNNAASAACGSYKTDVGIYTPPPLPSRPALLQQYNDPTFGACVKRITDSQTLGVDEAVHTYAELQAWNADQSLILLTTNQIIDAKTSQLLHKIDFGWPGTGNAVRWSPNDPLALYYTGELLSGSDGIACGVGKARLMRYRLIPGSPMRGQKELVHCFTEYSKFDKNPSSQEMSGDGRYIALVSTSGQAFLYDLVADKKLATVSVPGWIEWAEPSPLGDYLLINFGGGGDGLQSGLEAYNPQTGSKVGKVATGHGHGSVALAPDGSQWYVYTTFDNYVGVFGPYVAKARIPRGYDDWKSGDKTGLVAMLELDWGASLHVSCLAHSSEWCAVSTYAMTNTNVPFYQEVFRLSLSSTLQSPKVQRLVHHRSDRNLPASCGMSSYWADPHASTSRDGKQIIFGSSWGQACRAEAYVINLGS